MKTIDIKSLLIGILATALLFACADTDKTLPSLVSEAKAATSPTDKWDAKQQWEVEAVSYNELFGIVDLEMRAGWEPFGSTRGGTILLRKRVK